MELIKRDYAIIFIDWSGETLEEVESGSPYTDFNTKGIVDVYYNQEGFLQWNCYLILPEEEVVKSKFTTKEIENDEKYTRKFVVKRDQIDNFVESYFPESKSQESMGKITLIKGNTWIDTRFLTDQFLEKNPNFTRCPSWYRNDSLMNTLTNMDRLRADLIRDPDKKVVFYTHLSNEFELAEKKFKIFQIQKEEEKKETTTVE